MPKLLASLLVILLLAGCAPSLPSPLALDPTTAQTAVEDQLHKGFPTQSISNVLVRRVELVPGGAVALFTYETENQTGISVTATGVHELKREGLNWVSNGGATSTPDGGPLPPLGYLQLGMAEHGGYAAAGGPVGDPAIRQVVATFSDGAQEIVPVTNEAYFVVRQGNASIDKIQGLDERGAVLHTVP